MRALETCGKPVAAAINGLALGGGFELTLCCHHRVVADDPKIQLGLPEVKVGLFPGSGGSQRVPRLIGAQQALMMITEGKTMRPKEAVSSGLVHQVVPADQVVEAAKTWVREKGDPKAPWDKDGFKVPGGLPYSPQGAQVFIVGNAMLRKQSYGNYPAVVNLMKSVYEGLQVPMDAAIRIETRYFVKTLMTPQARAMIRSLFLSMQELNKGSARPKGAAPSEAKKVAVLGAGMMGAGIAHACARAGLDVVLKDVTVQAAERGRAHAEKLLGREVAKSRLSADRAAAVLARITATGEVADLAGCDAVIEAVFEDPALKHAVFAEVEPVLAPGALLASNTSTLPITGLATGVSRPADFIGMHFFSPVDRMPLLEIVVGEQTGDAALARAFDLGRRIGKTPIVVNDGRGFFTSRVIGRFLDEAIGMLAEGVPAPSIEQAALQAGYPTGPLALADEVSLSLIQRIRRQFEAAAGADFVALPAHALVDTMLHEHDRPGRAAGRGFYDYDNGTRGRLWRGLAGLATAEGRAIPLIDLQERMMVAEALDALRCQEEGVLRSAADGDIGSLLGIGFPAWTGGVLRYVRQYDGGPAGFAARATELAKTYGERFTPPASLTAGQQR
jgi:3-hydroxyacyl-CoA dehydrogenase/enoyl-CoA hydratase/3-hydroxybutyryl-CoA epimerase